MNLRTLNPAWLKHQRDAREPNLKDWLLVSGAANKLLDCARGNTRRVLEGVIRPEPRPFDQLPMDPRLQRMLTMVTRFNGAPPKTNVFLFQDRDGTASAILLYPTDRRFFGADREIVLKPNGDQRKVEPADVFRAMLWIWNDRTESPAARNRASKFLCNLVADVLSRVERSKRPTPKRTYAKQPQALSPDAHHLLRDDPSPLIDRLRGMASDEPIVKPTPRKFREEPLTLSIYDFDPRR